jgi:hypothetical protein
LLLCDFFGCVGMNDFFGCVGKLKIDFFGCVGMNVQIAEHLFSLFFV